MLGKLFPQAPCGTFHLQSRIPSDGSPAEIGREPSEAAAKGLVLLGVSRIQLGAETRKTIVDVVAVVSIPGFRRPGGASRHVTRGGALAVDMPRLPAIDIDARRQLEGPAVAIRQRK